MKLSQKEKKSILNFLLKTISTFGDKEYQKKNWIRGNVPEYCDFDESTCFFFEDCDSILDNYKEFDISEDQYRLLKEFRNVFDKFCDKNEDPEEFIESPEWKKIMDMAKSVLDVFDYEKLKG